MLELRGKLALVTGATGFIGGRLAGRLLEEGVRVQGLVRRPERLKRLPPGVEPVWGDLTDPASLARAVAGCDLIFHCAGQVRLGGPRRLFEAVNVAGARALAEAALQAGVARFVHVSSIAAYGPDHAGPVVDDTPRLPSADAYGDTKRRGEAAVFEVGRRGLPVVVLRPSYVYGPGSGAWTLLPLRSIRSGGLVLVGDGSGACGPVFVENLLDALLLAARSERAVGRGYLAWDGELTTWRGFFGHYARMVGRPLRSIPFTPIYALAGGLELLYRLAGRTPPLTRTALRFLSPGLKLAATGLRDELGWTPRFDLASAMSFTQQWLRERGELRS